MYDQLAILAPIMLAMTAGTPIFKGRLSDIDARWNTIAQSVDDRTEAERGLISQQEATLRADPRMAGQGIVPIPKSRYDSISTYIYHCKGDPMCSRTFAEYNDIYCPVDEAVKSRLRGAGIDENLAHHLGHLFCRDPISAFEGDELNGTGMFAYCSIIIVIVIIFINIIVTIIAIIIMNIIVIIIVIIVIVIVTIIVIIIINIIIIVAIIIAIIIVIIIINIIIIIIIIIVRIFRTVECLFESQLLLLLIVFTIGTMIL
jgi:hypothetical protein